MFFKKRLLLRHAWTNGHDDCVDDTSAYSAFYRRRIQWNSHAELLINEGQFERYYRMSPQSIEKLLALLGPRLEIDQVKSRNRTGTDPITPKMQITVMISYMAGYSYLPSMKVIGISKSAFFAIIYRLIHVLLTTDFLALRFPATAQEQKTMAKSFQNLSNGGIIKGCVGCVDGWLCQIQTPRRNEVGRVQSFFSGHYQTYGVNVQACCDSASRFTAFTCNSSGSCGDSIAFLNWKLAQVAAAFDAGYYLIGDNAYTNRNWLLTPFVRSMIASPFHDSYNFHLSQVRIRIEMAFGLLVNKWRIFKKPLQVKFSNVHKIIHAGMVLHNFCINERTEEVDPEEDVDLETPIVEMEYVMPVQQDLDDATVANPDRNVYRSMYLIFYIDVTRDTFEENNVDPEKLRQSILGSFSQAQ